MIYIYKRIRPYVAVGVCYPPHRTKLGPGCRQAAEGAATAAGGAATTAEGAATRHQTLLCLISMDSIDSMEGCEILHQ